MKRKMMMFAKCAGRLFDRTSFGIIRSLSGKGHLPTASKRRNWRAVLSGTLRNAVIASGVCASASASGAARPECSWRHLLAGRASLTDGGFVETRVIGIASFAPELRLPVEFVYRSASESSGMLGYGWSCPQLESSAKWDKDGLLWVAPWGEKVKFFPKKLKTPKNAVKIAPIEAAKKGRGL